MLRVAVAASGGRDSTALLHATVRAARGTNLRVVALHVHHGLNPAADGWQDAVRRQCGRWGVAFSTRRLATRPAAGQSIEAWARHERYAALAELATEAGCTLVLLAHHRRDQAETWLLQALRGAGVAGLSAMPAARIASGITWARPWLASPRDAVEAYVRRHRLSFVEDDSNADPRFDRNRLRLQVWPMLKRAFPDVEGSLAAAARRAQQATALAVEVAAHDLVDLRRERGGLRVSHWRELPPARRRNALAAWLLQTLPKGVPGTLVDRLLAEVPQSAAARWPAPGGEVRLYRGAMTFVSSGAAVGARPGAPEPDGVDLDLDLDLDLNLHLDHAVETLLPAWGGRFVVSPTTCAGVARCCLSGLQARPRAGGERFRTGPDAAPRSLKLQFQALGIPAWQRHGPLLFSRGGRLLYVPGLGIDAGCLAPTSSPQWRIDWRPDIAVTADVDVPDAESDG